MIQSQPLPLIQMNLTIIRELLIIYRNDNTSVDENKLLATSHKIKNVSSSKVSKNFTQMAPACWNLLVEISRLSSSSFSSKITFVHTSKVILCCAKILESSKNELKMGLLDLDKILANLISKLTEGFKGKISRNDFETDISIIELIEFLFERLQGHLNLLESGLRRMSLVELSSNDQLFIDVKFNALSPEAIKDSTIKQLCVTALESLCRLVLMFQNGPIALVLEALTPFHINSLSSDPEQANNYISHFISSVCKLEFWSQIEWIFWDHLSRYEIYENHLGYFKRRCILELTRPELANISSLSMKIIALVIDSGQVTDLMLETVFKCKTFNDEIIGVCLKLLLKEDSEKFLLSVESVLKQTPSNPISDSGLKLLLASLDSLRNGLFHFKRNDQFINFFTLLNEVLIKINFPSKFYVSWTSCVLKFAIDKRKSLNVSNLAKESINGLLNVFESIPEDMKPKVKKIITQTISISCDSILLKKCAARFKDSIPAILEASQFNLPQDYFNALSLFIVNEPFLLVSWVKVISNQIQITSNAFQFTDIRILHALAKVVSKHVFDQFQSSQCLDFIYNRMRELGCEEETILLSKQLGTFRKSISPSFVCKDLNIQKAFDFIKKYNETGEMNFEFENLKFLNFNTKTEIEIELFDELLNLIFIHAPPNIFHEILDQIDGSTKTALRFKSLVKKNEQCDYLIEGTDIYMLHSLYLNGFYNEALKVGYEKLKTSLKSESIKAVEIIELIVYLYRLAVSTKNLSESRYFLKQLFHLAETLKSENIRNLANRTQTELFILMGMNSCPIYYDKCEDILKSGAFEPFEFEFKNLIELDKIRQKIRCNFQSQIQVACNGIKVKNLKNESVLDELYGNSLKYLKECRERNLVYCVSEWSKICLLLTFHKSLFYDCDYDLELLNLFESARNPNNFASNHNHLNRLKGSIGLLHDQFLSIFWIMVVTIDSKLILFRINLNVPEFNRKLRRIHQICAQNTDSLRNTKEIAQDPEKKSNWWILRKSLDSDLKALCDELDEDLFSNISDLLIPCDSSSLISRNLFKYLTDLFEKLGGPLQFLKFTETFVGQLSHLGQFPKRFKIEIFIKIIKFSLNYSHFSDSSFINDQTDYLIVKLRSCFENAFDSIPINQNISSFNLLLDKDLNAIPFESFPLFNKFSFKRIPMILGRIIGKDEIFKKVFYIVNPSGDLVLTQERFENIFLNQPNWEGIIGRKPTADEFFKGICGNFDLFIYFGHSSGESYAPLKELKQKLPETKAASSALLIGCSSGRIKSNGVFSSESSIFYYLENNCPLILANLWDVTDKDIDIYIKGVLEDSDLLLPISSGSLLIKPTANNSTIIEKAHTGRQRCYLKSLNGFAPIIYGQI